MLVLMTLEKISFVVEADCTAQVVEMVVLEKCDLSDFTGCQQAVPAQGQFLCTYQGRQASCSLCIPIWTRSWTTCFRCPCWSRGLGPDDLQRELPSLAVL